MTENHNTMLELDQYRKRYLYALKAAHVCVFEVDLKRQIYTFFENAEDIFGVPGDRILEDVRAFSKLPPDEYKKEVSVYFSHPDDWEVVDRAFRDIFAGRTATYQARMKAGKSGYIWCKVDVVPVLENGVPAKMVGVITDIDKLKLEMDKLEKRASVDAFTGLYSKKYAEDLMARILKEYEKEKHAMLIIDLDDFKHLNDTYGHSTGDDVLKVVARQLKHSVRSGDIVGRLGGDEFGVFIRDIHKAAEIREIAERLLQITDHPLKVTKSIGISIYPRDGRTFRTLYERADQALYQAKRKKNTYVLYSRAD